MLNIESEHNFQNEPAEGDNVNIATRMNEGVGFVRFSVSKYNVGLIAMLRVGGSLSSQFILNDHFEWTTEKKK